MNEKLFDVLREVCFPEFDCVSTSFRDLRTNAHQLIASVFNNDRLAPGLKRDLARLYVRDDVMKICNDVGIDYHKAARLWDLSEAEHPNFGLEFNQKIDNMEERVYNFLIERYK
jgi:hypothetical protein